MTKEGQSWVLACLDASTGEALVSEPLDLDSLSHELKRLPVRHYLHLHPELELAQLGLAEAVLCETLPKNYLSSDRAAELLKRHYDLSNLQPFVSSPAGILALGTLVTYVLRTQQQEKLAHLRLPEPLQKPKSLILGPNTAQHLDLADLFQLINQTRSTLGARQLKRWMMAPLRTSPEISARQRGVLELKTRWSDFGEKVSALLSHVYDLERICGRVNTKLANPRDTLALGLSLQSLNTLGAYLSSSQSPVLTDLRQRVSCLSEKLVPPSLTKSPRPSVKKLPSPRAKVGFSSMEPALSWID